MAYKNIKFVYDRIFQINFNCQQLSTISPPEKGKYSYCNQVQCKHNHKAITIRQPHSSTPTHENKRNSANSLKGQNLCNIIELAGPSCFCIHKQQCQNIISGELRDVPLRNNKHTAHPQDATLRARRMASPLFTI